jgi:hypothetical protein
VSLTSEISFLVSSGDRDSCPIRELFPSDVVSLSE